MTEGQAADLRSAELVRTAGRPSCPDPTWRIGALAHLRAQSRPCPTVCRPLGALHALGVWGALTVGLLQTVNADADAAEAGLPMEVIPEFVGHVDPGHVRPADDVRVKGKGRRPSFVAPEAGTLEVQ